MAHPKRQKKVEALLALEQLEMRMSLLEKEKAAHLYNKRSEFRKDFCQLEEVDLKLDEERKQEKLAHRQQLNKVKANVGKFQRSLKMAKPSQQFVQKLKGLMEEIESSITSFKNQQREHYETLTKEEKAATQEITAFDKRIDSWASSAPTTIPTTKSSRTKPDVGSGASGTDYPPAIADFERFLQQTGGHQGGWDDYDHQTFLKIYRKHLGKDSFLSEAVRLLPGRCERDVVEHESWYQEYLSLKNRQKEAIHLWRESKENEKAEVLAAAVDDGEEEDGEEERRKQETAEKERQKKVARLAQWKAEQEMRRLAGEEEHLKEQLARAEEEAKERKRKVALKAKVEGYSKQKAEEKEVIEAAKDALAKEELRRRRAANKQLEHFQQRDVAVFEEKRIKQIELEIEKEHQAQRLEKLKGQVDVKVQRDPSRLYKLTEGWENRKKVKESSKSSFTGPSMASMPRRAVPTWRKGI